MTTYKEIRGKLIKKVTADPTPASDLSAYEGEIWYNSTIGALKVAEPIASVWSTAANSSSPATGGMVGFGTQSAAVLAGGTIPVPAPANIDPIVTVQEYDGTSWSSANSMSQKRSVFGAAGPQTASAVYGGRISGNPATYTADTEEYDGTNWTGGGAMGATRYYMGAAGTQTAAFAIGGLQGGPTSKTDTQIYNGSSWTAAPDLPTGIHAGRGSGTTGATLVASAAPPAPKTISMEYNGSSWSTGNPTNADKAYRGCSSLGTQSSSLLWGGEPFSGATEFYDGTNWSTEGATLGLARAATGGGGTGTTGLAISGESPAGTPANNATEEFTASFIGARTITSS